MPTPTLVRLPDGRQLAYAEWGDPDGRPILSLHGTPGCRLARHPDEDLVRRTGARVITYDRPGYGESDRHRGRRVVDCVADVAALMDALGIEKFAVTGGSGGGPHSLAVGTCLPHRVIRCACVVGVAPYDAMGEAFFDGMDPENVTEFGWALAGEERLHEELVPYNDMLLARVAADPASALENFDLPEADRAILARQDIARVMREWVPEHSRHGVWGWVDDDLAMSSPWGFDPAGITVPTALWWGANDVLVPAAHGEWLARAIPNARTRVNDSGGHLADPDRELVLLYRWLLDGIDWDD